MDQIADIRELLEQIDEINTRHEDELDKTGGRFNMFRACGVDHRDEAFY